MGVRRFNPPFPSQEHCSQIIFCRLLNVTLLLFIVAASAVAAVMAVVVGMSTSILRCRDAHGEGVTTD
jgi:hypothetical protein